MDLHRLSLCSSPPNYVLERSVRAWQGCAAGARTIIAPAALVEVGPRPAQLGRWTSLKEQHYA
jgi:hypothetical protein